MQLIQDYNPDWPAIFLDLKAALFSKLSGLIIDIHHIGSTAIPNMPAKPIIDIDIEIQDYTVFPEVIKALNELGYSHEGDLGIPQREAFKRKNETVPIDGTGRKWMLHHLYVCPRNSVELHRHLKFRNLLTVNESARIKYAGIKRRIALEANNDKDRYAGLKEIMTKGFVEEILAQT